MLLLVRHASAGSREEWTRDDRERPLDARGRQRARELVERLRPHDIEAIYSSPYRRCAETVEPLAQARGLEVELRAELGEDRQATDGVAFVRAVADRNVAVCGHGGLEQALRGAPKWKKGAVFVVSAELEVVEIA